MHDNVKHAISISLAILLARCGGDSKAPASSMGGVAGTMCGVAGEPDGGVGSGGSFAGDGAIGAITNGMGGSDVVAADGGSQSMGLDASSVDADGPIGDATSTQSQPPTFLFECALPAPGSGRVPAPGGAARNLKVLDWAGFRSATTYTFDDANASQIQHYAQLQALHVPMTFFLWAGAATAADPTWAQAVRDGHELGNHTQGHSASGTASDVDAASAFIEQRFGVKTWTMASPYGDASYSSLAQARFVANRGVTPGFIAPNDSTDPFKLPCYLPPQDAPASTINSVLDAARSAGAWQIMLVHGFKDGGDNAYLPIDIAEFLSSVAHTKSWGDVWIDNMLEIAAYWRAQKMFSSVVPTTSGPEQTWTWTLPEHFPPGRCLRVSVDGGTLKQHDARLVWNVHGYYEVSLDEGSLTLSGVADPASTGAGGNSGDGSSGSGGSAGSSGSSGSAGSSGSGGGPDPNPDIDGGGSLCRTGCAVCMAPLSGDGSASPGHLQTSTFASATFSSVDMVGATITFRLCVEDGATSHAALKAWVQTFSGSFPQYSGSDGFVSNLSLLACATGMHTISIPIAASGSFTGIVDRWGVTVAALDTNYAYERVVVKIDAVAFTNVPNPDGVKLTWDFAPINGGENLESAAPDPLNAPYIDPAGTMTWSGTD